MSQYPNDPAFGEAQYGAATPTRTSAMAVASLVCGLICCCPLTTIPAIILGIAALVAISRNPGLTGRGMAWAGVILGVLFTIGQAVVYPQWGRIVVDMWELVAAGPEPALRDGFDGNISGFKNAFTGPGATASDAEAAAFIDTLRERYGAFVASRPAQGAQQPGMGQAVFVMPYDLEFEDATVPAEVEIVITDPQGNPIMKLGSITVIDPDLGDLTYPPAAGGAATPSPAPPGTDVEGRPADDEAPPE